MDARALDISAELNSLLGKIEDRLLAEDGAAVLDLVRVGTRLAAGNPQLTTRLRLHGARGLLFLGRFSELAECLEELRRLPLTQQQVLDTCLTQAHGDALVGKYPSAIAQCRNVLSQSSPLCATAAKANYIIGLCCYRRGHYKWAKSLISRSAGYYRIANVGSELANMLNNLALVQKSEGDPRSALQSLEEAIAMLRAGAEITHLFLNQVTVLALLNSSKTATTCTASV